MHGPYQFFFLGIFILLLIVILFTRPTLKDLFSAVNSIDENPLAIIVIIIGCTMFVTAKQIGADDGVGLLILGWGGKMLDSQIRSQMAAKVHTDPSGATTTDVSTIAPAPPIDPNKPQGETK